MALINNKQIPDNSILDLNGRQVYMGNGFLVSTTDANIPSTSETPFFYFSNPANSGVSAFIYLRSHNANKAAGNGTSQYRYYLRPTGVSGGTSLTPLNNRINANSPSSQMVCIQQPTVTTPGTFFKDIEVSLTANPYDVTNLIILDPGNQFLVSVTNSAANISDTMIVAWYELPVGSNL